MGMVRFKINRPQNVSAVSIPGWTKTTLHSGFFTIDAATASNTFFVFAPALSGCAPRSVDAQRMRERDGYQP
jgi:hypothetical protein